MDQLSQILENLSFNADVFFSGNLCGIQSLGGADSKKGHLHWHLHQYRQQNLDY